MKTYNTSDIIFGTRSKYEELHTKLELLKLLTNISKEKEVGNIEYFIDTTKTNDGALTAEIKYTLIQNPTTINGLIRYLKAYINKYPTPIIDESRLLKDDNNQYYINQKNIYIEKKDKEMFKTIANGILQLDFLNKTNFRTIKGEPSQEDSKNITYNTKFYQEPNGIFIKTTIDSNRYFLDYIPQKNLIKVFTENHNIITNEIVEQLLKIKIDSNYLSDYQKELIDSNSLDIKKIHIDEVNDKYANFIIEEGFESIYLKKVRKKH